MKKVLCICTGGVVRSVATAAILKYRFNMDAIAASAECNSRETFVMLCQWADIILLAEEQHGEAIPERYMDKAVDLEIGPDVYGTSQHFILGKKVLNNLKEKGIIT